MTTPLSSEICSNEATELAPKEKQLLPTVISGQIVIYPEDPFAYPSVTSCSVS